MGECLISRRGGEAYKLPILDENYPEDMSVLATENGNITFSVVFKEHGRPESYTYQWYENGIAIENANNSNYILDTSIVSTKQIYCVVTNKAGSIATRISTIAILDPIPTNYTFDGNSKLIKEDTYNWRIEFYNSGKLVLPRNMLIELYLHGGGGGGGASGWNSSGGSGGGGGWFATHTDVSIEAEKSYDIVVGGGGRSSIYEDGGNGLGSGFNGGSSSAFGYSVDGGKGGHKMGDGGIGGSGNGGMRGEGKGNYGGPAGSNTTYAFNDPDCGLIYGGGGGGGAPEYGGIGAGGKPYGGQDNQPAADNTGAGGAGANFEDSELGRSGAYGGSGIVIIRNNRKLTGVI